MNKHEDGQHRASGYGQHNNGQRSTCPENVKVGQQSGGEQAMSVPACPASALVSTERKV